MAIIRPLVETGIVRDLQLRAAEAGVARHNGASGVIEADLSSIQERVADELSPVSLLDLDALLSCDDDVLLKYVVVGSPRTSRFGLIRAKVRVGVVPEEGGCLEQNFVLPIS